MIDTPQVKPPFLAKVRKMQWVRATVGGILKFHVSPGDFVEAGQAVATNYSIMGIEQNVLLAPNHGIILGMATMPAVKPGEPICNIATLTVSQLKRYRGKLEKARADPHAQAQTDLATNIDVVEA
jgi:predicted deacylase